MVSKHFNMFCAGKVRKFERTTAIRFASKNVSSHLYAVEHMI